MPQEFRYCPPGHFRGNWMSQQTVRWCHYWQAIHRKLERLPSSFLFILLGTLAGLDILVACLITLPPAFASSDKHLPPPACDLRGGVSHPTCPCLNCIRHMYCMLYRCSYSGSWQFMLRISQYMLHFHGWIALSCGIEVCGHIPRPHSSYAGFNIECKWTSSNLLPYIVDWGLNIVQLGIPTMQVRTS